MVHSRKSDHFKACWSQRSWYLHWHFLRWPVTADTTSLKALTLLACAACQLCFAEGFMTGILQGMTPSGFRAIHHSGNRVGSKLVALSLMDGAGRLCV